MEGERLCDHCRRTIRLDAHAPGWSPRRWGSHWVWICPQCARDLRPLHTGRRLPVRGVVR